MRRIFQRWLGVPGDSRSLLFALSVYREPRQLEWCLEMLRASYPDAEVLVISDGDPDPEYPRLAERFDTRYRLGERLKVPAGGGDYCHRFFAELLAGDRDLLVKIDPDSWVRRRFRYFPRAGFFGSLDCRGEALIHVQGGCQVFSRRACAKVVESGVSTDSRYRDPGRWCAHPRIRERVEDYQQSRGSLNVDFMVYDMMRRIGVRAADWHEARCQWPSPPPERGGHWAVTHPHRLPTPSVRAPASSS